MGIPPQVKRPKNQRGKTSNCQRGEFDTYYNQTVADLLRTGQPGKTGNGSKDYWCGKTKKLWRR